MWPLVDRKKGENGRIYVCLLMSTLLTITESLGEDPCSLQPYACTLPYYHTCKNGQNPVCQHECDRVSNFCGENGQCFFDLINNNRSCWYVISYLKNIWNAFHRHVGCWMRKQPDCLWSAVGSKLINSTHCISLLSELDLYSLLNFWSRLLYFF